MLRRLVLHKEYAQRVGKTRWTVWFEPGVNLLVGPNGSGKSTVIECLRKEVLVKEKKDKWGTKLRDQKRHATWHLYPGGEDLHILYFDFEKDNPRVGESGSLMDLASFRRMDMKWRYAMKSHGQFTRDVLAEFEEKRAKTKGRVFVVMDEPEQALDLDGLRKLHASLTGKKGRHPVTQAIIATHHPFLMADAAFNIIETDPGYHKYMMQAMKTVVGQL